jgi:3-phenylpropionate/trans-cinnamate dioxygenase ferredoxin subunit
MEVSMTTEASQSLIRVGTVGSVRAGEIKAFDVGHDPVAVANVDGRFHAFDDTCTHQGCSLADGTLEGQVVTCSCHGSQFDVTSGAVLEGPAEEPVRSHRVEVSGEDLLAEP